MAKNYNYEEIRYFVIDESALQVFQDACCGYLETGKYTWAEVQVGGQDRLIAMFVADTFDTIEIVRSMINRGKVIYEMMG